MRNLPLIDGDNLSQPFSLSLGRETVNVNRDLVLPFSLRNLKPAEAFEDRYNRAQYPITLGTTTVFNLNSGLKIVRGEVIIDGTATITGGTTNGTEIGLAALYRLIKEIRVVANKAAGSRYPNGVLVKCSVQDLLEFAVTEHQGKFVGDLLAHDHLGSGAAAAYTFHLAIPIYFGDSTNLNNVQTSLNMDSVDSTGAPVYTSVQVQIDWATSITDLFSGSDRAIAVAGLVQWKDKRLGIATDTTPLIQEGHTQILQAANTEFVDAAMPNNGFLSQLLIQTKAGLPGEQLADTILNKIEMRGPSLNLKVFANDIKTDMVNEGFYDPSQSLTGLYFLDFTSGLLANSNSLAGLIHQFDVSNPSGAGNDRLRMYTRRVLPLAQGSN